MGLSEIMQDRRKKKPYPGGHILNHGREGLVPTGACNPSFKITIVAGEKPRQVIASHFAKVVFSAGLTRG